MKVTKIAKHSPKSATPKPERLDEESLNVSNPASKLDHLIAGLKLGHDAQTFKLIDEKEWKIVSCEPNSETTFFVDGYSAMSIISVIGSQGVGKSALLNKIARKDAFVTHQMHKRTSPGEFNIKHMTKGIDVHSTYHRILLDCQPFLDSSVLEDFLTGCSESQFPRQSPISDPLTSCHMISLQLATFLINVCDYVIFKTNWLIDVHLLKLISTALMMIGDDKKAKIIIYSDDKRVVSDEFRFTIDSCLGSTVIYKYICDEQELIDCINPYTFEKSDDFNRDPTIFTGKSWLNSCQRLWTTSIKNSSMFSEYATQVYNSNNINI